MTMIPTNGDLRRLPPSFASSRSSRRSARSGVPGGRHTADRAGGAGDHFGAIGALIALSPSKRGGMVSIFAIVAGLIGSWWLCFRIIGTC
jgi:hypothetical protein